RQQALALLVRREQQRRILLRDREIQHFRNERYRFAEFHSGKFQRALELDDALLLALVAVPTEALVENLGDGVEGRGLEELVARAFDPQVGVILDAGAKLIDQPRLADPGLTHHQRDLPLALARPLPSAEQQAHLVVAPNERRHGACGGSMRAPTHRARLNHAIKLERTRDTLELLSAAILDHEQARNQALRRGGGHYGAPRGAAL